MKIDKHAKYVLISAEQDDVKKFATYLEYIIPKEYEDVHLIIDLTKYNLLEFTELLYFLKLSTYHRSTKHSLVIVNSAINPDDIPPEIIVVPTVQEAEDIIEMEEIERDLGF